MNQEYVDLLRIKLNLRDWKIKVSEEPPGDDDHNTYYAQTFTNVHLSNAEVYLTPNFFQLNDEEKKITLIHEVLHIFTSLVEQTVSDLYEPIVPKNMQQSFHNSLNTQIESMTEKMARAIAPMLPAYPLPAKKKVARSKKKK